MDNVGIPVKEALPLVVDFLVRYGLRDRIKVIASGKLVTPAEVAQALQRYHCRMARGDGLSIPLNEHHPVPDVLPGHEAREPA